MGMFFSTFLRRQPPYTVSACGYCSVMRGGAVLYPESYVCTHIDEVTVVG